LGRDRRTRRRHDAQVDYYGLPIESTEAVFKLSVQ